VKLGMSPPTIRLTLKRIRGFGGSSFSDRSLLALAASHMGDFIKRGLEAVSFLWFGLTKNGGESTAVEPRGKYKADESNREEKKGDVRHGLSVHGNCERRGGRDDTRSTL